MKNSITAMTEADITEMFQDYVQLDPADGVFTNRDLNLDDIKLIGFDMDYTLAVYKKETMEELQYRLTTAELIKSFSYPAEIQSLNYRSNISIRGLVVDKKRGHLLKVDLHGRVWRAMHGHRQLREDEIAAMYTNTKIKIDKSRFSSLDSLFSIPEATLYINLLDFFESKVVRSEDLRPLAKESDKGEPHTFDHGKLFDDIRYCMDKIHADGSLKAIITQNITAYIISDPDIALTLHKLRSAGKKLFLLTNSEWFYTDAVMKYLLENQFPEYDCWRSFFDVVIVRANKPSFFTPDIPFTLLDTKNGAEIALSEQQLMAGFEREHIYQAGNMRDFERLAQCSGEEILYIGDHIFGDIVRTKKESLWRTCLVVDELPEEIRHTVEWARDFDQISQMNAQRHALDSVIGNHRATMVHVEGAILEHDTSPQARVRLDKLKIAHRVLRHAIDEKKRELLTMDAEYLRCHDELERRFHPYWGRLFGEHGELSRFGSQVRAYACIYSGKLTNLLRYSAGHLFRATGQMMSHERALLDTLAMRKARLPGPSKKSA